MIRTPPKVTPFSLVYRSVKIQIPSLRVALENQTMIEDKNKMCLQEQEALDDKRLQALKKFEPNQARNYWAFSKKVMVQTFNKGDLVLVIWRPMLVTNKTTGMFEPK